MSIATEVTELHKFYGPVRAVDGISFTVEEGEIFGMVGPNGAGKTTTIECVEGLRRPDRGTVRVLGLDPQRDGYELRRRIGVQLQEAALHPRLKVWEALDLFGSFYSRCVDGKALLEQLGLADKWNAAFEKLSPHRADRGDGAGFPDDVPLRGIHSSGGVAGESAGRQPVHPADPRGDADEGAVVRRPVEPALDGGRGAGGVSVGGGCHRGEDVPVGITPARRNRRPTTTGGNYAGSTGGFMTETLSVEMIQAGLETSFVGRKVVYLSETGSTNDEARRLARAGAPQGTLVLADYQTAGRGRLGRRWEAPAGSSLLLSLLFRPDLAPHQAGRLTMLCGLAVADAIEEQTGLAVGLKWPNDILLGGAKAGGILTEIEVSGSWLEYGVVGIGLNVNLDPRQLPDGLLMPATSLSHALGRPVDRLALLWALLKAVERRYLALQSGHSPHAEWAQRLVTLHQPVIVSAAGLSLEGIATGVDADGALLVRLDDGHLERVVAGDVTLRAHALPGPA